MNFELTQEISELCIKNGVSDLITNISDSLSEFLASKEYGSGLHCIYIGLICVSDEFDFFFKIRKPKYQKGKRTIIQDSRPYEIVNSLIYDLKLNYNMCSKFDELKTKKIIITELINSFVVFDGFKIKSFDRLRFEAEVTKHLKLFC